MALLGKGHVVLASHASVSPLERAQKRSSDSVQRVSKLLPKEQLATPSGVVDHPFVDYLITLFLQRAQTHFVSHPTNQHDRDALSAEKLLDPDLELWERLTKERKFCGGCRAIRHRSLARVNQEIAVRHESS